MGILSKYMDRKKVIKALMVASKKNGTKLSNKTAKDTATMILMFDKSIKYLQRNSKNKSKEGEIFMYNIAHNIIVDVNDKLIVPKLTEKKTEPKKVNGSPTYIG